MPHEMHESNGEEPNCVRHRVHGQKRVHRQKRVHNTVKKTKWSLPHIVHASHKAEPKCVHHGVHSQKSGNSTIEKEEAELAKHSVCITQG